MNNKIIFPVVLAAVVGVGAVFFLTRLLMKPLPPATDENPVMCTMEAKLCPDGSYVGRVPPSCAFAECPATTVPPAPPIGWKTVNDAERGITFSYPEPIGTTYITTVDWPPKIVVAQKTSFTCTEAGSEIERAGKTERVSVNGRDYCVTRVTEGAAGSTYTQYAYAFQKGPDVLTLTFTLQFVQCGNYDDPKKAECEEERAAFNPHQLADQVVQTVQMD